MKGIIGRIVKYLNFIGLLSIAFYFIYVGVNLYRNSGNYFINILLLVLTFLYLIFYIYSVYIDTNKRIKKISKTVFKKCKKLLGFINACLVFISLFSNSNNSFITIFLAVLTLGWYVFYLSVDFMASLVVHRVKKSIKGVREKYDYRS